MASSATIWTEITSIDGPHNGAPVLHSGAGWESAQAAIIALHGRGAGAYDILSLADMVARPNWARVAPQAAGATWYPMSFMTPVEQNEPYLSSALALVTALRDAVLAAGVPQSRILLMGFSQGACLALESAARLGGRWGGAAALSGGLIGHAVDETAYADSLEGTPVFIGCSDVDPHIPVRRVLESETALSDRGAVVTTQLYPGMGHTVNEDELAHLRSLMNEIVAEQE